ncbi:MAG: tetratricopeptide repeat protein [Vicinamibacterales bacterium]
MKASSITFALGGIVFGLVVGWIIGDQQARQAQQRAAAAASVTAAPAQQQDARQAPPLDEQKAAALKSIAEQDPKNVQVRTQLANLYFDSERYQDAIGWYEQAFALDSKNADISTDLGVSYYYTNDADKALAQFDKSLAINPAHVKTLLNQGIVRAFGKQDMAGAAESWQKVVDAAPGTPEAAAAQRALESVQSAAHQAGAAAPAGN